MGIAIESGVGQDVNKMSPYTTRFRLTLAARRTANMFPAYINMFLVAGRSLWPVYLGNRVSVFASAFPNANTLVTSASPLSALSPLSLRRTRRSLLAQRCERP
mmetsp:Transcript_13546/g.41124  ORF Transcript_13546/g.41124 Transcript_13546/m.41124 type:complete len:103 (-) Transcript_13546:210-518(-)